MTEQVQNQLDPETLQRLREQFPEEMTVEAAGANREVFKHHVHQLEDVVQERQDSIPADTIEKKVAVNNPHTTYAASGYEDGTDMKPQAEQTPQPNPAESSEIRAHLQTVEGDSSMPMVELDADAEALLERAIQTGDRSLLTNELALTDAEWEAATGEKRGAETTSGNENEQPSLTEKLFGADNNESLTDKDLTPEGRLARIGRLMSKAKQSLTYMRDRTKTELGNMSKVTQALEYLSSTDAKRRRRIIGGVAGAVVVAGLLYANHKYGFAAHEAAGSGGGSVDPNLADALGAHMGGTGNHAANPSLLDALGAHSSGPVNHAADPNIAQALGAKAQTAQQHLGSGTGQEFRIGDQSGQLLALPTGSGHEQVIQGVAHFKLGEHGGNSIWHDLAQYAKDHGANPDTEALDKAKDAILKYNHITEAGARHMGAEQQYTIPHAILEELLNSK